MPEVWRYCRSTPTNEPTKRAGKLADIAILCSQKHEKLLFPHLFPISRGKIQEPSTAIHTA
jgi:hypothetical protein